jgi:hypothetical protein
MSAVIDVKRNRPFQQLVATTGFSESADALGGTSSALPEKKLNRELASVDLLEVSRNLESAETGQLTESKFSLVMRAPYRFQALKRWEGVVVAVNGEDFMARLHNLDNPSEYDVEAVIPVDEITESDKVQLEIGAVFYWTIGYRIETYGQKSSVSTIRFRRLPVWTAQDRKRLRKLASEYDAFFDDPRSGSR